MANNCIVSIRLTADSENGAANLEILFKESRKIAREKGEGIFIGCPNRYLFDCEIFRDRDTVQIFGWVKWGFENGEIKDFLGWLNRQTVITALHVDYHEPGFHAYGEYDFDGKTLLHRYLPQSAYPDDENWEFDENGQIFATVLECALKRVGVTERISLE